MIKTEMVETDMPEPRIRHYSDKGMMIRQIETGVLYEDAVDYIPCAYTYEETELPIEGELTSDQILDILFGGDGNEQSDSDDI